LNTQYLLGAAILYLNAGDLDASELYLKEVERIDPKTDNLDNIVKLLNERKLEVTSEKNITK
jgi:hypothetical protein